MSSLRGTRRGQEAEEGTEEKDENEHNLQSPAWAQCAHLASGASSPSRSGPSPHPQGLACHQSSCHLRACKRLQQMWGGGRGGVPRGSSSQDRAQLGSIPIHPHQGTHTHTHAHQPARQLTARPTLSRGGACSISASASLSPPNHHWGGKTTPHRHAPGFHALSTPR